MGKQGDVLDGGAEHGRMAAARGGAHALKVGPLLYGFAFVVAVPVLLFWWSRAARGLDALPAVHAPAAGALLLIAGVGLWLRAVLDLMRRGGGLPMNAYPTTRYVTTGAFALVRHPIYTGFALALAGSVVWSGSAAGLWLVLPVATLCMMALVVGYEGPALRVRLGAARYSPWLRVPLDSESPPSAADRISVLVLVFVPWLLAWALVQLLGPPQDAFSTALVVDGRIRIVQWSYAVYASSYIVVPLVPMLLRTRAGLRRFAIRGWLATGVVTLTWLLLPAVFVPRPFEATDAWGEMLLLDRSWCTGMAAFPSFHVLWSMLAAAAVGEQQRRVRGVMWAWAALVAASCLTTGMHGVLDVLAAGALFPFVQHYGRVWQRVRGWTERAANGWREWRLGPVRVINHGLFAGLGSAIGLASLLLLAPAQPRWAALAVAAGALLGAGAWAQLLESSSGLLRPFGYYGAVFGACAVALGGPLLGYDVLPLLAALAVGAPWVQLLGRARCLIQGCCHGRRTAEWLGIHYTHPRSRVSYLAHLAGQPLHATPLYSMAANAVTGVILLRLWLLEAPLALVVGVYLIANGLARFVEEGYRGEPQTPVLAGLRLYQWLAAVFVIGGAVLTAVPSPAAGPVARPDPTLWLWLAGFFGVTAVALGVDFPESNRRFSRLA